MQLRFSAEPVVAASANGSPGEPRAAAE